MIKQDS